MCECRTKIKLCDFHLSFECEQIIILIYLSRLNLEYIYFAHLYYILSSHFQCVTIKANKSGEEKKRVIDFAFLFR